MGSDAGAVSVKSADMIVTGGDNASGVTAQSIGGGGGNGGFSIGVSVATNAKSTTNAVGGGSGNGGVGKAVAVQNSAGIMTAGHLSDGILAQSIGGGGGSGGFAVSGSVSLQDDAAANATGGGGGNGGVAGAVKVTNSGAISVANSGTIGIVAQSIGGGGGQGGFAGAISVSTNTKAVTNSTGGKGGAGNDAAAVTVVNSAAVQSKGDNSGGILAQSIGGGGGNGGFALGAAGSSAMGVANSTGGTGGGSSKAGEVSVENDAGGKISTTGALAYGIDAQSVGGGGGNGGFAIGGALSLNGDASSKIGGGSGGTGSTGGVVTVKNLDAIQTNGFDASGILAESVGGGGGSGGFAVGAAVSAGGSSLANGTGGNGAVAGNASTVQVTNAAKISTNQDGSIGILAELIGGGGGSGSFGISAAGSTAKATDQSVGGTGGSAGAAGNVTVNNNLGGQIATLGAMAYGIEAQSVGGGGGNGAFSIGGAVSINDNLSSTVGAGAGGAAGAAGTATVGNADAIATSGSGAIGILAQSVGGGGGSGGFAIGAAVSAGGASLSNGVGGTGARGGNASTVKVTNAAAITTKKDNAIGILAQSVGGGGGNGGFDISAAGSTAKATSQSVGGNGGIAGAAGNVTVNNNRGGQINTAGAMAYGIEAQSVGGGGGNGAFSIGGAVSINDDAASTVGAGSGGAAGAAGTVAVGNADMIATSGPGAIGILAQSIGGGGGSGGFAVGGAVAASAASLGNTVGGAGGGGGAGNAVQVSNSSVVSTQAAEATGILAQSVGGGGGSGGFSLGVGGSQAKAVSSSVGGSGGMGGAASDVMVTNSSAGLIATQGDFANGIQAQSIGGGGGNGAFAIGGSVSTSGDAQSMVGAGSGGGGGSASMVTVKNNGQIVTGGMNAIGIFAQSVGGGGGSGGFAGGLSVGSSGSVANTVGGAGAGAGNGDQVAVTNTGLVHTLGANSIGVLAQSIGGGGGNGGFSLSASGSSGSGSNTSVGGGGGGGGLAKLVQVTNSGSIVTEGPLSYGVYAQSVGGGGGNGGFTVNGTLGSGSGGMVSSVGGKGGAGGAGGPVTVANTGTILVKGAGSVGVFAQSIGGGGGSGGFSGALNVSGGQMQNSVGGQGGNGGDGGNVTVTSTGSIMTLADNSVGVLAQSIGGGGGNGAFAISAQTGAFDGSGNNIGGASNGTGGAKGQVIVNVTGGSSQTQGALSYGLLAQAIGAGGGNGALSVPDPLTTAGGGVTVHVGATGGIAGDGSPLSATNSNPTMTTGAGAVGLIAQSIGGGGGTDGVTGDVSVGSNVGVLSATIGGSSTAGGSAGGITFSNSGAVSTNGDNATGTLVQAIGGGGGEGAFSLGVVTGTPLGVVENVGGSEGAVGNGANLSLPTFSGPVSTSGALAQGLLAQSIGGGGGFAGFSTPSGLSIGANGLTVDVGGGGAGGAGGSIGFTSNAQISTMGAGSSGLVLQSIGGGGGFAGFSSGGTQNPALAGAVLGGLGAGGSGGTVGLTNAAPISTTGNGSLGILAQSVGGGGGVIEAFGVGSGGTLTLGASGAAKGDGGMVTITNSAPIMTSGNGSHALVAQSIGGGGGLFQAYGNSGNAITVPITVAAGGGGNGGDVGVVSTAEIATSGIGAYGIVAQSIGGGGGIVGDGFYGSTIGNAPFAGTAGRVGQGGTVNVSVTAPVTTPGLNATAIFADSDGGSGGSNITINISNVEILGGTGDGHAVSLLGGANNLITSAGTLETVDGLAGTPITGGAGNDNVVSSGFVLGSVDLDGGVNTFDNTPSGIFISGSTVNLGPLGLLTNEGLLSPGGLGNVFTTNVTGSFVQTYSGVYDLDLQFLDQTSDRINMSGTANVAGAVSINILNPGLALPGSHDTTIISAAGGVMPNSGLGLNFIPTAVATYSLTYPDPNDIDLHYVIDFSPSGLTGNQHSVGYAINAIQSARSSPNFVPIAAKIFYVPTAADLGATYDSLSGEGTSAVQQAIFSARDQFFESVLQQAFLPSERYQDAYAMAGTSDTTPLRRTATWRAWANGFGDDLGLNSASTNVSSGLAYGAAQQNFSTAGGAAGFDYRVDPHWVVGLAGGGSGFQYSVTDRTTHGSGSGGDVGVYASARWDKLYAMGVLAYGHFSQDETRDVIGLNIGPLENARGDFNSDLFGGRIEIGRNYPVGPVTLTPFGALQFDRLHTSSYSETGAITGTSMPGVLELQYGAHTVASVPLYLGGQIDSRFDLAPGVALIPSLRVAEVHEFNPQRMITAEFLSAPGFPFVVHGAAAAEDAAQLQAGLRLALNRQISIYANFTGYFSGSGNSVGGFGGVKISW